MEHAPTTDAEAMNKSLSSVSKSKLETVKKSSASINSGLVKNSVTPANGLTGNSSTKEEGNN
jgi:hypothetical protein